jgi:hypothetical protein
VRLRGIGANSAWLYVMEFFGWRRIRNRKQLAAMAGLTPTPYQSGDSDHEQGISKAGNRRFANHGRGDCLVLVALPARECLEPVVSEAFRQGEQPVARC